jgi:peptidoglycan/LPS O-acetylase OafA/YrhL
MLKVRSPRERNVHLDAMRGMAAIVVLVSHVRQVFFIPYRQAGRGLLVQFVYIDHYVARAAVIVFFTLSGCLVGASVLTSVENGRWSWRNYLLSRLSRLYVVLIPALLLTATLDWLGRSNPATRWAYFNNLWDGRTTAHMDTLKNFFGSLFFLQTIHTDYFGSNSPLWSLSYELWYYIAFPVIVLAYTRRNKLLWSMLALAGLGWFVGYQVAALFPCWLAGVAAGVLANRLPHRAGMLRWAIALISVGAIVGSVIGSAAHVLSGYEADYVASAAAAVLIWAALAARPESRLYARASILLSEMSYTLYLTHLPLLILIQRSLFRNPWSADLLHICFAALPLLIALGFAYCFYLFFEARTGEVRRWLDRLASHRIQTPLWL